MLDGTEYFECQCFADEHTLRLTLSLDDEDPGIYTSVYLRPHGGFWSRIWYGLRYAFGYQSKFGAFGCWLMQPQDAARLKGMIEKLERHTLGKSVVEETK